jgi:LacI family transcriptional regulator
MYTMRDVARLAKVSVATVSAVVNGKGIVSTELTQRVKKAMVILDYHADHVARSLKVRRTNTIGVVIPDVTNPFFTDTMRGVEDEADAHGYSVILCNSREDPSRERRHLSTLYSHRVDGVLLAPLDPESPRNPLVQRRFPIVVFDRIPEGYQGAAVTSDNVQGAYEGIRHLLDLGHRRIAIIGGSRGISTALDRFEGFLKAMQEARIPVEDAYVKRTDFTLDAAYRCGLELLQLPEPPTAIFTCNNRLTLGLARAMSERGVRCPEGLSVVAFDDFPWADSFQPRLTTIQQPTYEIGRKAVSLLLSKIQKNLETPDAEPDPKWETVLVLKTQLRVRESTAPVQAMQRREIENWRGEPRREATP